MVRFLHTADFHLGSQLSVEPPDGTVKDDVLRNANYIAVERLITIAINEAVDFVVVAGDLYDNDARSVRANSFIADQFERLNEVDIPVYVIYGNHDPVGSATRYIDLPPNVHEFDHREAEEALYPDSDAPEARIWGQSYRNRHEERLMYSGFTPVDDSVPIPSACYIRDSTRTADGTCQCHGVSWRTRRTSTTGLSGIFILHVPTRAGSRSATQEFHKGVT